MKNNKLRTNIGNLSTVGYELSRTQLGTVTGGMCIKGTKPYDTGTLNTNGSSDTSTDCTTQGA